MKEKRGLAKLAVRNTLRRGRKSWVTVIGVFIGIAAVVSLVSIGQGLEFAIVEEFEALGADNIFVTGELDDRDVDIIRGVRGVEDAAAIYEETSDVEFQGEEASTNVRGVDLNRLELIFDGQGWSIEEGRELRSTDRTSTLTGPAFPDNYERAPSTGSQISVEGQSFRIAGQISAGDPQAQNSIVIGLDRAREIFDKDDEVSQIIVRTSPGFTQAKTQENIEETLRRDRGLEEDEEDFSTQTPQDIQDALTNILGVVQAIVVGLASIALLVGGIGIMNTMYMAINERTQEIGVMKAIGASRSDIRTLFLMESGLIGLLGGIIGVMVGIGISEATVYLVGQFSDVAITRGYTAPLIIGALTFSTLLGVISGYLPSRKASKLDPADALRYE